MAKKTKQTKETKRRPSKPPVYVAPDCDVRFTFTAAVLEEPEIVRRLAHRVVDLLADSRRYQQLSESVTENLACLVDDLVIDKVTDLLEEARAAGKEASRG